MRKLLETIQEAVPSYTYASLAEDNRLPEDQAKRFVKFMGLRFPGKEGTDWGYHDTWAQRFYRNEEWEFADLQSRDALKKTDSEHYEKKQ